MLDVPIDRVPELAIGSAATRSRSGGALHRPRGERPDLLGSREAPLRPRRQVAGTGLLFPRRSRIHVGCCHHQPPSFWAFGRCAAAKSKSWASTVRRNSGRRPPAEGGIAIGDVTDGSAMVSFASATVVQVNYRDIPDLPSGAGRSSTRCVLAGRALER